MSRASGADCAPASCELSRPADCRSQSLPGYGSLNSKPQSKGSKAIRMRAKSTKSNVKQINVQG